MGRGSNESRQSLGSAVLPRSRRVSKDDSDLLDRVETVRHQHEPVLNDVTFTNTSRHRGACHSIRPGSGWNRKKVKRGLSLYSRQDPGANRTREWLTVGHINCSVLDLAKILSPSIESDLNSVMKELYRSAFIYGSVVHCSRPQSVESVTNAVQVGPLLVKTCSFVSDSVLSSKNDQLCFVERLRPSQHGGFTIAICSLPARELATGTASSNNVREIHPFSMLWSVEPAGQQLESTVHVIFHFRLGEITNSNGEAGKHPRRAAARMEMLAKGITKRLGSLAVARKRRVRLGSDHQSLSIGSVGGIFGLKPTGHRNTRCIVCTRHLFGFYRCVGWRRCDLCAYLVCKPCCSAQQLPPCGAMRVCDRCMDSHEFREYSRSLKESPPARQHANSDPGSGRSVPVLEDIESKPYYAGVRTEQSSSIAQSC